MALNTEVELRELIRKRGTIRSKLTTFIKYVSACEELENSKIHELQLRAAKIEKEFEIFESVQEALELAASEEEYETCLSEREEIEELFLNNLSRAKQLVHDYETRTASNVQTNMATNITPQSPLTVESESHVKLPTMHLPTFSGSYEAWPGFSDAFRAAIHENPNFREAQKLIYLQSCLTGKAAEKIESLETTAANYSVAWNLLQQYYDDPSIVISKRIQALFELPTCTRFNVTSLGELVDQATKHYRALEALNKPFMEAFPIYAITSKLDDHTRLLWKERTQGNALPNMEELLNFLHNRRKMLETSNYEKSHKKLERINARPVGKTQTSFNQPIRTHSVTNMICSLCQGKHFTQSCTKLTNSNVNQRLELVKKTGLCTNCLRTGHFAKNCLAGTCKHCKGKHHTLLHKEQQSDTLTTVQANATALKASVRSEILLSTAIITIRDNRGNRLPCRVLLDSGSQSHFLTERFSKKLGLPTQKLMVPVIGINQTTTFITSAIKAQIHSRINKFSTDATFLVIPQITESLPFRSFSRAELKIPNNLPLADPNFNTHSEIDGLIGAELFLQLLCIGQISIANNLITLQETKFGWIFAGRLPLHNLYKPVHYNLTRDALDGQLARFWEVEEPPKGPLISTENRACENHFQTHVSRDSTTGRYTVCLPFKDNSQRLGESYSIALKRYHSLERKLSGNSDLKREYTQFLNEYQQLGHMSQTENPSTEEGYYLPHNAVIKQSSLTTKLRVVFDASAQTTNGTSLNDTLLTGPTIQDDLFSLLVRFRSHAYVITADIEKMYRQILIHPVDRKYQKILWRSDVREPIKTYTLNTVTYGTSAAPFLAIRALDQLANDEGKDFPRAATVIREDFYVDDLLTGAKTFEEVVVIRNELIELCKRGGFKLRQWASNDKGLVETLNDKTNDNLLRLDLDDTVKTLGLLWSAKYDIITYDIRELKQTNRITKRSILSQIATLFDPLGILGPIIVRAKILLQKLWKLRLDWDESVPIDIHTEWTTYCHELTHLRNLKIKRQIAPKQYTTMQLHGFCDASEQAYGACMYLRAVDVHGTTHSQLIASKSRLAPVKTITLPRLELCAAQLLAKLYEATAKALRRLTFERIIFWSDSTIVLHWLNTSPDRLKTFVAHRVEDIQRITDKLEWHHVRSADNPADLLSRGSNVTEFTTHTLWHHGPAWLKNSETIWPITHLDTVAELPDMRSLIVLNTIDNSFNLFEKFSSYTKLKRVVAYTLRFRFNSSRKENHKDILSTRELRRAERCIVKSIQQRAYRVELAAVTAGQTIGNLASLNPFLDDEGVLRVGGRLSKANIHYSAKHPILLPKDHYVTQLIVREQHLIHVHSGVQATLNAVRQRFWIPNGKNLTKKMIHKCITCYRAKPSTVDYKMSDLPSTRVTGSRPFLCSGVDYCGPIYIKEKTHRNRNKIKIYLAIFVCFATKAIHIEIVGDLTSEAFLAALRRFFARRGRCSNIYSDNAINFIGAKKEIKELYDAIKLHNDTIATTLATEHINWHLIPPRSPHFGELWEAAVRSTKHHLTRVIGDTLLSYEALLTYVNQIEAILNSRPLTPLSSDPNDLTALTPAHFLIGERLTTIPEFEFATTPNGRLSSWQHLQKMRVHFWKRWSKEYLQEQTTRRKWQNGKKQELGIGTLVLLKEDNTPPMTWPLGRIVATHPGTDGTIRVVTVKTISGEYKRCVKKIAPLPLYNQD